MSINIRMRITEVISEPKVQTYSIGDSHGEGIARTSNGRIINYAHGGRASTNSSNYSGEYDGHPTGIDRVPPGSRVIISQGCNDAANSSRANLDSNGRVALVPPERIAANVARLVTAATSRDCDVIFVLFPNGDAKVKPYYGGPHQLAVREAIKSAVTVPVIDLEGSALSDGVHCVGGAYRSAGERALAQFANKTTVKEHAFIEDGGKQQPSGAVQVRGAPSGVSAWQPDRPVAAGSLQAWRGDARTGNLETLPHSFNPNAQMTKLLGAYKWARDRKLLPVIAPETWAMLALVEGREDFGYNGLILDNRPQQQRFADMVKQAGMTDYLDLFWIVFLHEKIATAKRTGLPFYRIWNGSGIYQARFLAQAKAIEHPKNKPFLDWFKQQLA